MKKIKVTFWQDADFFIGCLDDYTAHLTQGIMKWLRSNEIRLFAILIALCNLTFIYSQPVSATLLTGNVNGNVTSKLSPDGKFTTELSVAPVEKLKNPTPDELNLLKTRYPKWTFVADDAATGKFNVLQYDVFGLNQRGGADFAILYDDEVVTPRTDYSWIQIGYPTNWGSKDSAVFNDAYYPNFPFYSNYTPISLPTLMTPTSFFGDSIWLDTTNYPQQKIQNPAGGGKLPAGDLLFQDEPWCLYTCVMGDDTTRLVFDLFLVSFTWNGLGGSDAGGKVTLYDGMRWGIEIYRVPEPSTFAFFLLGLLSILFFVSESRPNQRGV